MHGQKEKDGGDGEITDEVEDVDAAEQGHAGIIKGRVTKMLIFQVMLRVVAIVRKTKKINPPTSNRHAGQTFSAIRQKRLQFFIKIRTFIAVGEKHISEFLFFIEHESGIRI